MNRALGTVLAAVALLACAFVLAAYLGGDRRDADVVLIETRGDVSVVGPDAQTRRGEAGDPLRARDRVTTGVGARAVVGVGGDGRLDLGPSTSIEVTHVDADAVGIELYGGRMSARVLPDSRSVRVAAGDRALAMTDAELDIALDSDGVLYAQLTAGAAQVEGVPGADALSAGQRLVAAADEGEIGPIPAEFFLAVEWPVQLRTSAAEVVLAGTTRPRATVDVLGGARPVQVRANEEGRFSTVVPLVEGENAVEVRASEPLGEAATEAGVVQRDSSGPTFSGDVEYRR